MERIPLRGQVSIEGANAHPHAARRLRESFPAIEWIESTTLDRPASERRLGCGSIAPTRKRGEEMADLRDPALR